MRLRELFEKAQPEQFDNSLKAIGICFGRFNPPHRGHRAVWESAATNPIWFVGTNEATSGPKDPLPYDVKLQCMAAVWPKVVGHVVPEQSLLTLATSVFEKYGENVHLKVYTDEEWLYKTLAQYNGVQGKAHGGYKFHQIDWVRTERLASATDLRAAARAGDRKAFYKDMGVKPTVTVEVEGNPMPIFDVVAHYLNMYPEKTKKVAEGTVNGSGIRAKGVTKKPDPTQKAAMKNATTMPDLNQSSGSAYLGWRMGIALAGAPDFPTKAEADNWIGGDPLLSAYTEEEQEMIKAASLAVGGGRIENWSGKRSQELPEVNKTSPVAKPKKNKYGV